MSKADEYYLSLPLEPNAVWRKAIKEQGYSRASGVEIEKDGERYWDGGACFAKYGKYHLFYRTSSQQREAMGLQRWIVNTDTHEVRRIATNIKRQELKAIFTDENDN